MPAWGFVLLELQGPNHSPQLSVPGWGMWRDDVWGWECSQVVHAWNGAGEPPGQSI